MWSPMTRPTQRRRLEHTRDALPTRGRGSGVSSAITTEMGLPHLKPLPGPASHESSFSWFLPCEG